MEGLGDVVVGASVEALDLVAPAVARGKDEDRHGPAGAPPRLQHRDAVHLGQADVEDHRIIGLAFPEKVALLAVEGTIDHVARIDERGRELAIEIGIVLDHEETQDQCSPLLPPTAAVTVPLHKKGGKVEEGWQGRPQSRGRGWRQAAERAFERLTSRRSRGTPSMIARAKAATSVLLNALRMW